jgi:aspartyl/asparaginyl-tRNA synthetase
MESFCLNCSLIKIRGIVYKVNKFNRNFAILFVFSDGKIFRAVVKDKPAIVKKGDYVKLSGNLKTFEGCEEIDVIDLERIERKHLKSQPKNLISLTESSDLRRLEMLSLRMFVVQRIHEFFKEKGFLPIQSPTITGSWVVGKTEPFEVKFYSEDCYLSISNMLYHQIVMTSGFTKIYELGKLHRQEKPSSKYKLAEFTILDISLVDEDANYMIGLVENLIYDIYEVVKNNLYQYVKLIEKVKFEYINYRDLLQICEIKQTTGSQLPSRVKKYLRETFDSFVWILGFPENTRPFYTKSNDEGMCIDYQLWYKGVRYFAAGSEIERNIESILRKMHIRKKKPQDYNFYLPYVETGFPEMVTIGFGLELFLSCIVLESNAADFAWFPRYNGNHSP